jgi:hypothetical protein
MFKEKVKYEASIACGSSDRKGFVYDVTHSSLVGKIRPVWSNRTPGQTGPEGAPMNTKRERNPFLYLGTIIIIIVALAWGFSMYENAKYPDPQYHGGPVDH